MRGTLNLKKAVTKYSDRPNNISPSPNFMRLTQSYINNVNDSRAGEDAVNLNNNTLNTSGLLNKSYLNSSIGGNPTASAHDRQSSASRK